MKHVGLHNAQKVTIILHKMQAPDEHMCLVVYDDKLPSPYFQPLKAALATPEAQAARNFADVLDGVQMPDERQLARILFTEGHFKKVPTNQVFATPYGYESANKIKLNDLNEYLDKIDEGGDALKRIQELEEGRGMHKKKKGTEAAALPIPSTPTPTLPVAKTEAPAPAPIRQPAPSEQAEYWEAKAAKAFDPQSASNDLRQQGDVLKAAAVQLLQQAKILAEKAETIYPTAPKRGRGRPKGSGLKVSSKN